MFYKFKPLHMLLGNVCGFLTLIIYIDICNCRVQSMSCSKACRCSELCTNKPFRKEKKIKIVKVWNNMLLAIQFCISMEQSYNVNLESLSFLDRQTEDYCNDNILLQHTNSVSLMIISFSVTGPSSAV